MTDDLEGRLTTHLHGLGSAGSQDSDSGSLDTVRQIAKRRSLRTRVAVGICGLAAIAGVASLVPRGDDPSALVTAADPVPEDVAELPTEAEEAAEAPETVVTQADEGPTEPLADLGTEIVRDPLHDRIIGDGLGGFVAFLPQTSDQALEGVVTIVRSADGEDWVASHDWQLPEGHTMNEVRHVDGHFVAIVENSGLRGIMRRLPLNNPRLALSTDLVNWRWIDLNLNPPGTPNFTLDPRHTVGDIAINGNDVIISVVSTPSGHFSDSQTQIQSEHGWSCGGSWSEAAPSSILWCDGDLYTAGPDETPYGLGLQPPERRLLLSEAGATAVVVDTYQPPHQAALNTWAGIGMHIVFPTGDDFTVFDVRELTTTPAFGDWVGSEVVAVARRSNQERVLLLERDGRYGAIRFEDEELGGQDGAILFEDEELEVAELPEEVVADATFKPLEQLQVGPAGWAALITDQSITLDLVEQDGWVITGSVVTGDVLIEAEDGSERHWYNPTRSGDLSPGVERGLFGGMRFYRPGTEEILVELTAEQIKAARLETGSLDMPSLVALRSATLPRSTTSDGWTLSGDAVRGPLFLISPTGLETEFADGFGFDNDDITDGVETDLDRSVSVAQSALELTEAPIRFFDSDGNVLVEFSNQQIVQDMVEGEYELTALGQTETTSWVVFSPDGVEWEIIWSQTSLGFDHATKVIVGDDEVLIDTGPKMERIALDD